MLMSFCIITLPFLVCCSSPREKEENPSNLIMGLGNPPNNENCDPKGRVLLEHLRCLNRQLAAEVNRKTGELIILRLTTAEAKHFALERDAEQRRRGGAGGGV
jgi:hypothetical protein